MEILGYNVCRITASAFPISLKPNECWFAYKIERSNAKSSVIFTLIHSARKSRTHQQITENLAHLSSATSHALLEASFAFRIASFIGFRHSSIDYIFYYHWADDMLNILVTKSIDDSCHHNGGKLPLI